MKSSETSMCVFDGFTTNPGDLSWEPLERLGSLKVYDRTLPGEIKSRGEGNDILITNKVVLSREVLAGLSDVRLVCLMSTGTNSVDLEACAERNIPVCNIPAYSTASVAELVFSLLFARARSVEAHDRAVHAGDWVSSPDFTFSASPQAELAGRTLGLIGFGDIARAVARAAAAFGMRVLATTPHPDGKPDLGQTFVALDTLLAESDIVSLHCPLTPQTDRLIGGGNLKRMKPGAWLVNTGRGGLLHEGEVAKALETGALGCVMADVLSTEPPKADNPLLTAPNCILTPHIAWATRAARQRLLTILADNVKAFLDGSPQNVVNDV